MNGKQDPCPADALQVSKLSEGEWRVADGRLSDQSPAKVLGFIQRRAGAFEVLHIETPDRDLRFADWDSAVASFTTVHASTLHRTR